MDVMPVVAPTTLLAAIRDARQRGSGYAKMATGRPQHPTAGAGEVPAPAQYETVQPFGCAGNWCNNSLASCQRDVSRSVKSKPRGYGGRLCVKQIITLRAPSVGTRLNA